MGGVERGKASRGPPGAGESFSTSHEMGRLDDVNNVRYGSVRPACFVGCPDMLMRCTSV